MVPVLKFRDPPGSLAVRTIFFNFAGSFYPKKMDYAADKAF